MPLPAVTAACPTQMYMISSLINIIYFYLFDFALYRLPLMQIFLLEFLLGFRFDTDIYLLMNMYCLFHTLVSIQPYFYSGVTRTFAFIPSDVDRFGRDFRLGMHAKLEVAFISDGIRFGAGRSSCTIRNKCRSVSLILFS